MKTIKTCPNTAAREKLVLAGSHERMVASVKILSTQRRPSRRETSGQGADGGQETHPERDRPRNKKSPSAFGRRARSRTPAMPYSRVSRHYHRPWMLNGRVRNGNGCGHLVRERGSEAGRGGE